jgi:hypothetical protein
MSNESGDKLTIKDGYKKVDVATGKASEINRNLALAGIAVIWIFKVGEGSNQAVPGELVPPAVILVVGLALDLLQYLVTALVWLFYTRDKETKNAVEFKAPPIINLPSIILFVLKVIATFAAYIYLIIYLASKLLN